METDRGSRRVGAVSAVTAASIRVDIDLDAPHGVSLGGGSPLRFPHVNGLVVIPGEEGTTVGLVSALKVVPSTFPKRTGLKDYGVVDLPYPARQVEITPLGVIRSGYSDEGRIVLRADRGVLNPPTIGAPVLIPTDDELQAVLEGTSAGGRVEIGRAALSREVVVQVDPDRLFGRHVAVLGNTGGGKSCSVAGLVRWSIEAAGREVDAPNARFIVLDPNGEYRNAFDGLADVKVLQAETTGGAEQLRVPAWLWNGEEWAAFSEASRGVQRPLLARALRSLRAGELLPESALARLAVVARSFHALLKERVAAGPAAYTGYKGASGTYDLIKVMSPSLSAYVGAGVGSDIDGHIERLCEALEALLEEKYEVSGTGFKTFHSFSEVELDRLLVLGDGLLTALPLETRTLIGEDSPIEFEVGTIASHLEALAEGDSGAAGFAKYVSLRITTLLEHVRFRSIIGSGDAGGDESLERWLDDYLSRGSADASRMPSVVVVDLSLVPDSVVHIVSSVISRLVLEALQRYRRSRDALLPTTLVVEEAHHFIGRAEGFDQDESRALCRKTFETIAREGRKFGLGLVISSQRPSEVSPTVLSQCNTFLLHRIVNDRDQDLVRRLVPDNLGSLLDDLPSLPTQHAILLGWATSIPLLVRMKDLLPAHRPRSEDPKFWGTWIGEEDAEVDWGPIASEWRSGST